MTDERRADDATPNTAPGFADHPDHNIDLAECAERQRAIFAGNVIADSAKALIVQEASYPPVIYFPRDDVRIDLLELTNHGTHCPFKGDACYWSVADRAGGENIAWSYEAPYDEMAALQDYIAFYTDRVSVGP